MNVLGISGSLRRASLNTMVLRAAIAEAPAGMTITQCEIGTMPFYDGDVEAAGTPASVTEFRAKIAAADAVLIVTPEYNASISGVLKNAIDWASRPPAQPFDGKPVAILGASPGVLGTIRAQLHLRQILLNINAMVLNGPQVLIGAATQRFDAEGRLVDEATRNFLVSLLSGLQSWTQKLKG